MVFLGLTEQEILAQRKSAQILPLGALLRKSELIISSYQICPAWRAKLEAACSDAGRFHLVATISM
jgi:hypothetical protein